MTLSLFAVEMLLFPLYRGIKKVLKGITFELENCAATL